MSESTYVLIIEDTVSLALTFAGPEGEAPPQRVA